MPAALQHQARTLAALLPPLLLEAERVAAIVQHGLHGRRRAGSGESFWQYRRYDAGDPAERIDWRASARSDRLYVREREWEAAQTLYLWADASGSMRYRSSPSHAAKGERAQLLLLALATLAARGGEKPVWLAREAVTVESRAALARIAAMIDDHPADDNGPPAIPLAHFAHIVLASDFLMPPAELESIMRRYAAQRLPGVLLHIIDPAEDDLPFEGRIDMQGCEGEPSLLLDEAGSFRARYRERMAAHKTWLQRTASGVGWLYLVHRTETQPYAALLQIYRHLAAGRRGF